MKKTDREIAVTTARPGSSSGRRWCRVALAATAIALPMAGFAVPAGAATTSSAHQAAHVQSTQLVSAQLPAQHAAPQWGGPFWWGPGFWWGSPFWWGVR